jgi:hypothetical protein
MALLSILKDGVNIIMNLTWVNYEPLGEDGNFLLLLENGNNLKPHPSPPSHTLKSRHKMPLAFKEYM